MTAKRKPFRAKNGWAVSLNDELFWVFRARWKARYVAAEQGLPVYRVSVREVSPKRRGRKA